MTHTVYKWTITLVGVTLLALVPIVQGWAEEGKMMSCPADMVDQGEYCIDREPQEKLANRLVEVRFRCGSGNTHGQPNQTPYRLSRRPTYSAIQIRDHFLEVREMIP